MKGDGNTVIGQIWATLDAVEAALLAGNYSVLDALVDRQECLVSLFEAAPGIGVTQSEIVRVQSAATRTQHLIAAALRGMKSASDRQATVALVTQSTRTYDRNGRAATFSSHDPAIERRR